MGEKKIAIKDIIRIEKLRIWIEYKIANFYQS